MHHPPVLRPLLHFWNSPVTYLSLWIVALALEDCLDGSLPCLWMTWLLSPLPVNGWTTLSPPFEWLTLSLQICILREWLFGPPLPPLGSSLSLLSLFCSWWHSHSWGASQVSLNCSLSLCWKAALWRQSFCLSCSLYNSLPPRQHHIPNHLAHRLKYLLNDQWTRNLLVVWTCDLRSHRLGIGYTYQQNFLCPVWYSSPF